MGGSKTGGEPGDGRTVFCCGKTTHPPPLPLNEGAMPTLRPPVAGNEESQAEGGSGRAIPALTPSLEELSMAFVRVEQRNARLAAGVRIDTVQGKDGPVSKGTAVAISNIRRQGGEEEATSIQWTFWGKQAESAAEYLGKGSRVNIVGRVQNNNYENADKVMVYGLTFTCEEIDYLDSRAEGQARREKAESGEKSSERGGTGTAVNPDDIPF